MSVFVANEQDEELDLAGLHGLAELILKEEGYPTETEVTLLLVSEEEMTGYNERFLSRSGPTDVLAFPVEDLLPGVVPEYNPHGPPLMIGDIIVAPAYVRRQASEIEVTFEDEMALMVTHGILHLIGYDHQVDDEAERMEQRERDLLGLVGRERR
ncbi:MAG: rRNA maturation RNase YbeY [Actinomycetota bacterium]|nr:rRNA maturation RNase YbeY [Actinomycetota bacterium]